MYIMVVHTAHHLAIDGSPSSLGMDPEVKNLLKNWERFR